MSVVAVILGVPLVVGNFAFWWYVVKRGQEGFRRRIERRYNVVVTLGSRGHWCVSGSGSRLKDFGIELLQLAYFMGASVLWSVGALLVVGLMSLVTR